MASVDDRIAAKKADLDKLRPSSRASLDALSSWYDVELTYTSNAIEGNTLTRSETALVLEKGITVGGKPLKDHLEAVGHKDALDYVHDLGRRTGPLGEHDVRRIHSLVMGRLDRDMAGRYATGQRLILGTSYVPPTPAEVPALMGDFGRWLSQASLTFDTAITAHERIAVLHPFDDGNGRTARLVMNLLLARGGFPPVAIGPEQRPAYLDGLDALTVGGDRSAYRAFMAERLEASLDHHLMIVRRGLVRDPPTGE